MPDYWAMGESGQDGARLWQGPFDTLETAQDAARSMLTAGRLPDNPAVLFSRRNLYKWTFAGTRFTQGPNLRFGLDGTFYYDRELGPNVDTVDDGTLAGIQATASEGLEDICFGPLEEDFCDPCQEVTDYLNDPIKSQISSHPINAITIVEPGVIPAGIASLIEVLPAEVTAFPSDFGDFYNWVDFRGTYLGFWTLPPIIGTEPEDNGTDAGAVYYLPGGDDWGYAGMPCKFLWLPPVSVQEVDGPELPIPLWPLNGIFPDDTITEQTARTFLLKYKWNSELFAIRIPPFPNTEPGHALSARGGASEDSIGMNRIYAGVQSGELPGEAITFERSFWETAVVAFAPVNPPPGGFLPENTAYWGWAMGVRFSITPVYRVTDNDMVCLQDIDGEETHFSIIHRSSRTGYAGGTYFKDPFIADETSPEWEANHNYNLILEVAGDASLPWDNNRFVDTNPVHPPADIPLGPPVQRKFLGWSGNGIPLALLLILNPNWAVQAFLENYKPFQGIPGYKYVIQFLQYITGKRSQYTVIATDPETGFDLYPVPVIVGADGSGFAVYGPAVYTHDTQSYY